MADVLFKRGTQSALDSLRVDTDKTKRIPGAFYLTEDSHRLYIGIDNDNRDIVPVNEGITTVDSISQLPKPSTDAEKKLMVGQFYYIEGSNILAIYSGSGAGGSNSGWIQINANTDTSIESFTQTVGVSGSTATISSTIKDTDSKNFDSSFKIVVAGGLVLSVDATNTLKIDASALQQNLNYSVSSNIATVTLTNPKTSGNKIDIQAGNYVTITEKTDKTGFVISGEDQRVQSVTVGNGNAAGTSTDGFNIAVKTGNKTEKGNFDPTIKLANDTSGRHFSGGTIELPVYTTTEIDNQFASKLNAIDGMTYKGTIGSGGTGHNANSLPTTNVRIGDTYKVLASFTTQIGGVTPTAGDVIIARSTTNKENSSGYIDSSNIAWDLIPSGNEDTTYVGEVLTHGIALKENNTKSVMAFKLSSGNDSITLTDTTSTGSNEVKITHVAPTAQTKDATSISGVAASGDHNQNSLSGSVVYDVLKDGTGHVAGLQKANISFTDTNATLTSTGAVEVKAASLGSSSSKVSLTTTLKQSSGRTKTSTSAFTVYSDNKNLQVSSDDTNDAVKVSFVWDSF